MDKAGLTHQFLPPAIRAVDRDMVVVGRAMPVQVEDVTPGNGGDAYGIMFRALDELKPGEVYVTAGGSPDYALWGGLMSTRAMRLGAAYCGLTPAARSSPATFTNGRQSSCSGGASIAIRLRPAAVARK